MKAGMKKTGIGFYGDNGHQVTDKMLQEAGGYLAGICACSRTDYAPDIARFETLDELLEAEEVEAICVCAPLRSLQGEAVKRCLKHGKHVYAEKPCVMSEEELDDILLLAEEKGVIFCEMSSVLFGEPYTTAGKLVSEGILGEIVQIFIQKSYPYADFRPQREEVDGGLILQNAIYGAKFTEHVAGMRIRRVAGAIQTGLGNPAPGELKMAASIQMELENGGIATIIANYLNQSSTGVWGNEELRIFGTKGYLKTEITSKSVLVYTAEETLRFHNEECADGQESLFLLFLECIREKKPFPYSAEFITHPLRMVLRAGKEAANGKIQ